jgi:hypothetical protein
MIHHITVITQSKQQGEVMDVRAAKVVAGLEPECTNAFLIALAECAADPKYVFCYTIVLPSFLVCDVSLFFNHLLLPTCIL